MWVKGSYDRTAKRWDTHTGSLIRTLNGQSGVWALAFSPDSRLIASGGGDGKVIIWDSATGHMIHSFKANMPEVWCMAFTPDGSSLATGGNDKLIKLWNVKNWTLRSTFVGHRERVWCLSIARNGLSLA